MKYLLIPLTVILWILTSYYGFYYGIVLIAWMFNLSWIWIILGYPFLIGLIFGLANGIPSLLRFLILRIFGLNWLSVIVHSIAGLIGMIMIFIFFKDNPIEYVSGETSESLLSGMWRSSPLKTIILFIPCLGLIISIMYSSTLAPILLKFENKNQ
ncbi:hypothetical protein [Flavobacterium petrolei]|uniref:hypothetical protein n=1 Tax=Flavobacterium petrolei TaxID=2259594 RepID=UPI0037578C8C